MVEELRNTPYRVLCLDGGGMRGLYTAAVLDTLIRRERGSTNTVDAGKAFDLIVGTSTGGILAMGLAKGIPLQNIIDLYTSKGKGIFPNPMPKKLGWSLWLKRRKGAAQSGQAALRQALDEQFGNTTVKQLYDDRGIAVCIPSVVMSTKKAWVFKTPHTLKKNRDDNYKLTDVCMATAAAPILLPLVAINDPDDSKRYDVFADGGLWANNPSMVGLIEALEITNSKRDIQIISISTASPPEGKVIKKYRTNLGLGAKGWKVGVGALEASLNAQASGVEFMTKFLIPHLKTKVEIIRLAYDAPSSEQALCVALDRADGKAIAALTDMAKSDAENNIRGINTRHTPHELEVIKEIINSMPLVESTLCEAA